MVTNNNMFKRLFRVFTQNEQESEYLERYQDFGPLEIKDHKKFLQASKAYFNNRWKKHVDYNETINSYEIIELISGGSFSEVFLAKQSQVEKHFAIKILAKETLVRKNQITNVLNEKFVLQGLNSPFTIYLVSFFKDSSSLYFVLPFITGGELFNYCAMFKKLDESQVLFFVAQIVLAFEYLHFLDLIYRDLKPENVLVDHFGYLKLADFGFCKKITERGRTYTFCGTPEYLAPEMILGKGYGVAVDWWALGVFMFELGSGRSPFYHAKQLRIYGKICKCEYTMETQFSPELQDIIRNFLQKDLSKRFGILKNGVDDVKNHRWFRPVNWLAVLNRSSSTAFIPEVGKIVDKIDAKKEGMKISKDETVDKYENLFVDF